MLELIVASFVLTTLAAEPPRAAGPCLTREACRSACEADEPIGCRRLGRALADGWGGASDSAAATAAWRRGCVGGDALSCAAAVVEARAEDLASTALTLSRLKCEGGDGDACVAAAALATSDVERKQFRRRACALDVPQICLDDRWPGAEALGMDDAAFRERDDRFAARCRSGDDVACEALGVFTSDPAEHAAREEVLMARCSAGWPRACRALGRIAFVAQKREAAARHWAAGCRLGDGKSCADVPLAVFTGRFQVRSHTIGCSNDEAPGPERLILSPTPRDRQLMIYSRDASGAMALLFPVVLDLDEAGAATTRFDAYDAAGECRVQRWQTTVRRDGERVIVTRAHDKGALPKTRCGEVDEAARRKALACDERERFVLEPDDRDL